MPNEIRSFVDQDAATQMLSLVLNYVRTTITALIASEIGDASDNQHAAGAAAVREYVKAALAGISSLRMEAVDTLPAVGEEGVIYLVTSANATDGDARDEYVYLNGAWERIGSTQIDLSGYWGKDELQAMTAEHVTTIWEGLL